MSGELNVHSVQILFLPVMLLLQGGTTLSQGKQVSSSSSSLERCVHMNLHPGTLSSRGPTTSSTSARCCPQQEPGHSLLSSACSVTNCGVIVMWVHILESIETRSNQRQNGHASIVCVSTALWQRPLEV